MNSFDHPRITGTWRIASRRDRSSHRCQPSNGSWPAGQRRTRPIMAASMALPAAEHDALADRCLDAALALSESAARAGFRGPDPFDGLWWHWPRRARRRPSPPAGDRAAARALAVRRAPALSPPPPAYRQGARGLRLGRGARAAARAAPRARDAGLRAVQLLDADRERRTATAGATPGTCRRAGASIRRAARTSSSPRSRRAGCSRGPRAGSRRPRRTRARGRALGPRRALDRAGGLLRLSRGRPVNIHNASLLGAWLVDVAGGADRAARERVARAVRADARRAAPRRVVAVRRGAQPRAGRTRSTRATCCCAWTGCAPWIPASARRCSAAPRTTAGSSTRRGARSLWADKPFPEDAHSAGTGLSTLARPRAPRRSSSASCSSAWRCASSITACAAGAPCTGATAGARRPCATCAGATRTSRWGSSTRPRRCRASRTSRRARHGAR